MVMMFVGGSCVYCRWNSSIIPTVEILRGVSVLFLPKPIVVTLLKPLIFLT